MSRRRPKTADEIGSIHIEQAARPQRPPVGVGDDFRRDALLHRPRMTVSLPEPPDGSWVNWRETEPWEHGLVVAARMRERRAELAMFEGLIG